MTLIKDERITQEALLKDFALSYWNWYLARDRKPNLIGFKEFEDFFELQIIDSLLPYLQFPELFHHKNLIDVGTGGGFPLLVLYYWMTMVEKKPLPEKFLGIDSTQKKLKALQDFINSNLPQPIDNLKLHSFRLEDIIIDQPCVLVFKAVGNCKQILSTINLSKNITSEDVSCIFYKGPEFQTLEGNELKELEGEWDNFILKSIDRSFWPLQKDSCVGRYLVGFKPKRVLRGTSKSNNKKVNLSELLKSNLIK